MNANIKVKYGIVLKVRFRILYFLLTFFGTGTGVSDDYKVWVKVEEEGQIFKIRTQYKLKIGEQVKIIYDSANPKKCELDEDWYLNKLNSL